MPHVFIMIMLAIFTTLIFGTIFWIWMLVDCARNKALPDTERVVWILVLVFTHLLGAIIYFFAGRTPQRQAYPLYIQRQALYMPYPPSVQTRTQYYMPYQSQAQRQEPSLSYQQGYPAQKEQALIYQENQWQQQPSELSRYERYEYPQASYPEQQQEQ